MKSVILGDSLISIGQYAFQNCHSLSYISFGDSIRNFGHQAFHGCDSLTINVSKLETLFNDFSFSGNNSNPFEKAVQLCLNDQPITELDVPNTVKEIKGVVFNGRNITALKVSDSVEKIGDNAFKNCEFLQSIVMECEPPTLGDHVFENIANDFGIYIKNTAEVLDAYRAADKWNALTEHIWSY